MTALVRYDTDHLPVWYQARMGWFTNLGAALQSVRRAVDHIAAGLRVVSQGLYPAMKGFVRAVRVIQEAEAGDISARGLAAAYSPVPGEHGEEVPND